MVTRLLDGVGEKRVGDAAPTGPNAGSFEVGWLGDVSGRRLEIVRLGADKVGEMLPQMIRAVKREGKAVVWSCDPMHGNTISVPSGFKTRRFEDVMDEVRGFFEVHRELGTFPGGIHVEMTGDDVAECLGGSDPVDETAFAEHYETLCDPRLNHRQSLEIAFLVAEALSGRR